MGYARLSAFLLGTGLRDTETGCKFFRRQTIFPVLEETACNGWFWDTEIMTRAYYAGLRILEIPTPFIRKGRISTVRLGPAVFKYLTDLFRFLSVKNKLRSVWIRRRKGAPVPV